MKEKKQSPNWYVAATHYLTAGFIVPLLIGFVVSLIINSLGSAVMIFLILIIARILAIWLGVIYSARYISKTYILKNKNSVVNYATTYFVVLSLGYIVFQSLGNVEIVGSGILFGLISIIVSAFLFYIFSKKYIKEDGVIETTPTESNIK